jgi:uncharacterized protein YdaU (DUF1376 family)
MAKKVDIWMPLYIGDYLADTSHLDAQRSGAYLHLLMRYWRKGPLVDDMELLMETAKLRGKDATSILQALLEEFFTKDEDGFWHQSRQDREREKWQGKKAKAIEKATLAAAARWGTDAPSNAHSNAKPMLTPCPLPLPSSLPLTLTEEQIPPLPPKGETIKSSEFFDAWNQLCGKLPKAEKLTPGRIKKIQARVRNGLTLSRFCEAVRGCTVKPFLSGNNDRGWTATFDWLIANDENAEKAIVNPYGNAANGKHVQAGADNQKQISEDEAHAQWQSMSEEFKRANPWGSRCV